jgi:hypothetical protein
LFVPLILTVVPASFGATLTGCQAGTPVSDNSGGFFVTGTCDLYREPAAYPFDLTAFLSSAGSTYLAENYLPAGYIVFTSDGTEVTDQTALNSADWEDVLYFAPNVASGTLSSQVTLEWGGTLPSTTTVNDFTVDSTPGDGELFLPASGTGFNQFVITEGTTGGTITFNVHDTLTPEPSTFLLFSGGALGVWVLRRWSVKSQKVV